MGRCKERERELELVLSYCWIIIKSKNVRGKLEWMSEILRTKKCKKNKKNLWVHSTRHAYGAYITQLNILFFFLSFKRERQKETDRQRSPSQVIIFGFDGLQILSHIIIDNWQAYNVNGKVKYRLPNESVVLSVLPWMSVKPCECEAFSCVGCRRVNGLARCLQLCVGGWSLIFTSNRREQLEA